MAFAAMRRLPLETRMGLLVLMGILPLLAFNLSNIYSEYQREQAQATRQALDVARNLSVAVQAELRTHIIALQVLALSRSLAEGDMLAFRTSAERLSRQSLGVNTILLNEDGQQLMNTALPLDMPLPNWQDLGSLRRVFATGLPAVSDLFFDITAGHLVVAVEVPVHQNNGNTLALAINPTLDAFDRIIRRQKVGQNWFISILDGTGRRVARVPSDARVVGQPATAEFLQAWSGVAEGTVQVKMAASGAPVLAAFSRLPEFDWGVVVAIPITELTGPVWRSSLMSLILGSALLALGLALARLVARSIAGPISALRRIAFAADGTVASRSANTGLRETDEVAEALLAEGHRRQHALAELANNVEALERSNKELDDFAYIASHDLKEPLRGLSNNAKFLREDYENTLDEQGVNRLLRLCYLSQRMEQLVNDLLYFSRLGRQELAVQLTDINAVIHDIEMMSEMTLKERNAVIVIPQELPRIICDKVRITEVFRNLIINAVKYNDKARRTIEVGYRDKIITDVGIQASVFYVKDNGMGIAEEFHEDIFRIFKRLNAEDDDKKGTGVGLTFVRKIIERHGGRVWLTSVLGEGTTFYFSIEGAGHV